MEHYRKPAQSYRDLIVWQKAHAFVLSVYTYSEGFPQKEVYGLTSQLRRAAISVSANIAEGFIKRSAKDKARFLNIAQGSLEECSYYLILSQDLLYGNSDVLKKQCNEVGRILNGFYRAVLGTSSKY